MASQQVRKSPGVWQDVVHARLAVGRLGQWADKHQSRRKQPPEHVGSVFRQYARQNEVVPVDQFAGEKLQVFEVVLRAILDTLADLVRRAGRRDGTNRPGGCATEIGVLLKQNDAPSEERRFT